MKITLYSEHAFRVLVYLAENDGRRCTVTEIARAYGVPRPHLVKVVRHPGKARPAS